MRPLHNILQAHSSSWLACRKLGPKRIQKTERVEKSPWRCRPGAVQWCRAGSELHQGRQPERGLLRISVAMLHRWLESDNDDRGQILATKFGYLVEKFNG